MSFDYRKKLPPEGQLNLYACWAASISWWTKAMSLDNKRMWQTQDDISVEFTRYADSNGGMDGVGIRKVCESAKIHMFLQYIPSLRLKTDFDFGSPSIIIFNYPAAGGTHMNVIFDQQGDTVMCMEPFYPLAASKTGERFGTYIRRPLSFFTASPQVGIGCLPLQDKPV